MRIKPAAIPFSLQLLASTAAAQWNPLNPVKSDEKQTDGVLLRMQSGLLRLRVCSDSIVRILYTPTSSFPAVKHYAVIKTSWPATRFSLESTGKDVTLNTSQLKVIVARKDGAIVFMDSAGNRLMQSSDRRMSPVVVNGERTYHAEEFITTWGSPEGFFGLGQHQAGVWNYRGESVDISQDNSNISIPMLLSTNGYGLFWDNPSRSRFNNRFMQSLYISSEVADQIDYYFIYGPEFDKILGAYRELTGAACNLADVRARRFDCAYGARDGILEPKRCEPHRAARLPGCRCGLHALRRRWAHLRLREGRLFDHSYSLG